MDRGSWQYQDDVSPSAVDHVWKVIGVVVAAGSGQLVLAALLPHDRPLDLAWFGPGFVIMNALLVALVVLGRHTRRRGGQYAPPAPVALAVAAVALVGVTLQSIGLSGAYG